MGFRRVEAVGKRHRIIYRVERAEVAVAIVLAGLWKAGDKRDLYAVAKKPLKQGLLR
jgi:hypothetical protein